MAVKPKKFDENEWARQLKIKKDQEEAVQKALDAHKAAGLLIGSRKSNLNQPGETGPYKSWDKTHPEHPDYVDPSKIPGEIKQLPIPGLDIDTASTPQDHPRYPSSPFYNTPNELKGVSPWIKDELQIRKGKEIFKLNTGIPLAHHTGGGPGLDGFQDKPIEAILQDIITNEVPLPPEDLERILGPDYEEIINQFKLQQQQKQSLKIGRA